MSEKKQGNTTLYIALIGGFVTLCTTVISVLAAPLIIDWNESRKMTAAASDVDVAVVETSIVIPTEIIQHTDLPPTLPAVTEDLPVDTAMPESTATPIPTITSTWTPTLTSTPNPLNNFVGTWWTDDPPQNLFVSYSLNRVVITKFNENNVSIDTCRCKSVACGEAILLDTQTVDQGVYATLGGDNDTLDVDQPFYLGENQYWTIEITKSGNTMLVKVLETKNGVNLGPQTFELKKLSNLSPPLLACSAPVYVAP